MKTAVPEFGSVRTLGANSTSSLGNEVAAFTSLHLIPVS